MVITLSARAMVVMEKHADFQVGASRSRLVDCRTDTMRPEVTFERSVMDVNWPSRRCGLAIFGRVAAPSAREENGAREEANFGG